MARGIRSQEGAMNILRESKKVLVVRVSSSTVQKQVVESYVPVLQFSRRGAIASLRNFSPEDEEKRLRSYAETGAGELQDSDSKRTYAAQTTLSGRWPGRTTPDSPYWTKEMLIKYDDDMVKAEDTKS